jgi:twitching motility protein PilT
MVLEGVLSQILLPRAGGKGRVLALEIMVPNPAIRNLIREEKVHQIYSQMQMGQSKFEMQTMNQSLCDMFLRKMISYEDAVARSSAPDELNEMIAGKHNPMETGTTSKDTQGTRFQAKTHYGNR